MLKKLKKLAEYASDRNQQTMKRYYFGRQIRRGVFRSDEPEYESLHELVSEGDWVIDVGANVGHYTLRLSQLVKSSGHVFAFEPIPLTFELLAANCTLSPYRNITLFNAAASDSAGVTTMQVPVREGRLNYYKARMTTDGTAANCWNVFKFKIDALDLPQRVSLVKIDAEGHELHVVQGMTGLIERHHPIVVIERSWATSFLESLGYVGTRRSGSPNYVWRYPGQ